MKLLLAVAGILAVCTTYGTATLQVLVNGRSSDGRPFCPNDNVTFVCNLQLSAFRWTVGSNLTVNDGIVTAPGDGSLATVTRGLYTLTAQGLFPNIMSTLQVTIITELNGSVVTCADANPNNNQTGTVMVYGNPSAPIIVNLSHTIGNNIVFSNLMIDPPSENPECVTSYMVTVNTATVEVPSFRPPARQTITINTAEVAGTLPCVTNHNFTVRPSNGDQESEVVQGIFDYNANRFMFSGTVMEDDDHIAISVPSVLTSCIQEYEYTYLGNTTTYFGSMKDRIPLNLFPNRIGCADCIVTIRPVVIVGTVLTNSQFQVDLNIEPTRMPDTTTGPGSTSTSSVPVPLIAGVVGGVGGVALILLFITIGIIVYCKCMSKSNIKGQRPLHQESGGSSKENDLEALPTYQDPTSIKRQTADQSSDVYTVPQKKSKKGSNNADDMPMYSVVDKAAKKQDLLVYADIDVKNSVKPRSRPPAPPGVTEHDPNEPVVYSVVQK